MENPGRSVNDLHDAMQATNKHLEPRECSRFLQDVEYRSRSSYAGMNELDEQAGFSEIL